MEKEYLIQRDLEHENIVRVTDFSMTGIWRSRRNEVKFSNLTYLVSENCARGELFKLVVS